MWNAAISHRLRLEQRFIESADDNFFVQRFRYRFELLKPIQKIEEKFVEGFFAMLQNEVFLNVQNKEKLNGNLFDQNRLLLGGGYRVSKNLDIELGYLNKFTLKSEEKEGTHIVQLALTTSF